MENSTFKETTIHDYLPKLYEAFPDVPKSDIKKIVEYGWRLIYLANLMGCDTCISSLTYGFWFYIGRLTNSSLLHFVYYKRKLIRKILYLYRRRKPEWDGYYYSFIYDKDCPPSFKKGTKKAVNFTLKKRVIFKNKDMCALFYPYKGALIKFKYDCDLGVRRYILKMKVKAELVELCDTKSFKDILILDNDKYDWTWLNKQ